MFACNKTTAINDKMCYFLHSKLEIIFSIPRHFKVHNFCYTYRSTFMYAEIYIITIMNLRFVKITYNLEQID
jgi:hypothetical protein